MKIAVPTSEESREAVHGHVASAPYFVIVDLDTDEITRVPNPLYGDEPREINPVSIVRELGVDAVLCTGIGTWAVKMLNAAGIKVYKARGGSVMSAIDEFRNGKLRLLYDEADNEK